MRFYCIVTLILACLGLNTYGQQWIDKKYTYDSLLNVPYGTAVNFAGGTDTLRMDIFLPDCDDPMHISRRPLLVLIHGGAFLAGSKEDNSLQYLCRQFARRGYVTASINYRLGFISDDQLWQCNYPNYGCIFATDSAEWARSYFRAVQDAKGAIRFLVNRHQQFRIDVNNIFIGGESAGAFTALGAGLLDTLPEKPPHAYAISDAPAPHPANLGCSYNLGKTLTGNIPRPDLGSIDGTIEPTIIPFTIKGIGNFYGAMLGDLLKNIPAGKARPAIYSFHRPCDIVVPIDSNYVYWGISWCMTNGYGCYGIANTRIMLYGSRVFSNWNTTNGYGYDIHNEFTTVSFPFSFLLGQASCTDQVNNPCHAIDNGNLRENNLATFFSGKITTSPVCDTITTSLPLNSRGRLTAFPNPALSSFTVQHADNLQLQAVEIFNIFGQVVYRNTNINASRLVIDVSGLERGIYMVQVKVQGDLTTILRIARQ